MTLLKHHVAHHARTPLCVKLTTTTALLLLCLAACGDGRGEDGEEVTTIAIDMGRAPEEMGQLQPRTRPCEENERVEAHQCIPCEPGRSRPAGDDPDGINTWCEPILCEVQERVEDYQCVPCPIEEYNDRTHRASDGDTACLRDRCSDSIGAACKRFDEAYIKAPAPRELDGFGKVVAIHGDLLAVSMPGADEGDRFQLGAVLIYERTRGDRWSYRATLAPTKRHTNMRFGASLAWGDGFLVVGASGDQVEENLIENGAVYVFAMRGDDPGSWEQVQRITAFNAGSYDNFGASIALSEGQDRLIVGAPFEDGLEDDVHDSGAAYLYARAPGEVEWRAAGYVKPEGLPVKARFGSAVAISRQRFAVSAPRAIRVMPPAEEGQPERTLNEAGVVYLYHFDGERWELRGQLVPEVHDAGDLFGASIALVNDRLLVGAPGEDSASTGFYADPRDQRVSNAGAAYLFEILPDDSTHPPIFIKSKHYTMTGMEFGHAVAMTRDMIVIGAHQDSTSASALNGTPFNEEVSIKSGAVFVYRPSAKELSGWDLIASIKAKEKTPHDLFGEAVSVDGYSIAIGAPNEDSSRAGTESREGGDGATDAGAVYIRKVGHFPSP